MKPPQTDAMQSLLLAYCARTFPDRVAPKVIDVNGISSGWESELHTFVLEWGPVTDRCREALVLRAFPGDGGAAKAAHEFRSMRRLRRAGYPVPGVMALEQGDLPFGKPFLLMEKIEGEVMWPSLSRSTGEAREATLALFCKLMVQLHALDWRPLADDSDRGAEDPFRFLDRWTRVARDSVRDSPEYADFSRIVSWLEGRRDALPCPRPSATHQDFHPNNVLVRPDGSAVVIDWTGFAVTDPRFDLAWTLTLACAYAGQEMRDQILHQYELLSGSPVEHVECFEACTCARRLLDIAVSLSQGAEKRGMRPEAVAAMKQQREPAERVYGMLTERTGLRVPCIESALASLS